MRVFTLKGRVDEKCVRCDSRTCKCSAPPLSKYDLAADEDDALVERLADEWEKANPPRDPKQ